ncbi:MAG: aminoacyl-tRNA deacylase [Bacillota bacterium]
MAVRNNVTRLLDSRGIQYQALEFSPGIKSAAGVAEALGLPLEQVFKTLVVLGEKGRPLLVVITGSAELDLKRLARAVGEKKLRMATHREAEDLTGLQVGGISPLALLNRGFDIYLDELVQVFDTVCISAGQRGVNIVLPVEALLQLTGATLIDLG